LGLTINQNSTALSGFFYLLFIMLLIDQIAEHYIQEAQERGEFDNLPGAGKPLMMEDDSMVPEDLRVGYRLLKNAGYLPPELQLHKEIHDVEQLLAGVQDASEYKQAERRLRYLRLRLNQYRGDSIDLMTERQYQQKLLQKL
jgi:DnaJ-like protein